MGCTASTPAQQPPPTNGFIVPVENQIQFPENPDKPYFRLSPCDDDPRPILYPKQGMFSEAQLPTTTLAQLFFEAQSINAESVALKVERPVPALEEQGKAHPSLPEEDWTQWTWRQYYVESRQVAKSLLECKVTRGEGVLLFGHNAPEWLISCMGVILSGALTAGLYPTDSKAQVEFKANHSRARVAIVDDASKVAKFDFDAIPSLSHIVMYASTDKSMAVLPEHITLLTWKEFMEMPCSVGDEQLDAIAQGLKGNECCSLIYTSGTTGNPKAVMITHDNILCEGAGVANYIPGFGQFGQERILSFLPLSHVAGSVLDIFLPLYITARCPGYMTTYFSRPYDLKSGTLGERIKCVLPTLFFAVPRIWEKFADKLRSREPTSFGLKRQVFQFAKTKGLAFYTEQQVGKSGRIPAYFHVAENMVHKKLRAAIGLSEAKALYTGAAPFALETQQYLASLGLKVLDTYGMSECCGSATTNTNSTFLFGTCGSTIQCLEVKVFNPETGLECPPCQDIFHPSEAEQGEMCYRGRTIMLGYMLGHNQERSEVLQKNSEAIDRNGWLHSGDKGCCNTQSMFRITGRFQELIITAGGENIAPVPIEEALKHWGKGVISNAQMVGDGKRFNVCLITLQCKNATGEKPGTGELDNEAATLVPGVSTVQQAQESLAYQQHVEKWVQHVNNDGNVCPSNASKIQRFTILPLDFSVETDELTSTLKLKRSVSEAKYSKVIEAMYAANSTVKIPTTTMKQRRNKKNPRVLPPPPPATPLVEETEDDEDEQQPPSLLTTTPPNENKQRKIATRAATALVMMGSFLFIVFYLGHLAVCALIVVLQTLIFKELVSLRYQRVKQLSQEYETEIVWFRTIQWLWFFVAMVYAYGSSFLKAPMGLNRYFVFDFDGFAAIQALSFFLFIFVFLITVLSFQKGLYKIQLIQLTWTLMTLTGVVAQLKFAVYMVHEGLLWFLFPVSLVVANDTFAYFCGLLFGKRVFVGTQFLQLSPNKTWEGFVGGGVLTVLYAIFSVKLWAQSRYIRCAYYELENSNASSPLPCFSDGLFDTQPGHFFCPMQQHALFFGLFASLVAPFGGFFASAIKRAFKVKDFDSFIPGHGGVTDRMDCQFIMSLFSYVYYSSFISNLHLIMPLNQLLTSLEMLDTNQLLQVKQVLQDKLGDKMFCSQ